MGKTRFSFLALAMLTLLLVAACSNPPETQVFIVVSPTHQPPTLTQLAAQGVPADSVATQPAVTSPEVTQTPGTPAVTGDTSGFPTQMPTANPLPTALVSQIQVAEQHFENGWMFWLLPTDEIWVLVNAEGSTENGTWMVFDDTFEEGDVENDPELTPPADLMQPVRGFGKLWRDNEEIRDALGWGVSPEYGYVTNYEYRPGGYLDSNGDYVPGPGVHVLYNLGNQVFAFEERDNTWRELE